MVYDAECTIFGDEPEVNHSCIKFLYTQDSNANFEVTATSHVQAATMLNEFVRNSDSDQLFIISEKGKFDPLFFSLREDGEMEESF